MHTWHTTVLKDEVVAWLDPKPNGNYLDGTLGDGGHMEALLEKNGPEGKVLGIDLDAKALERAKERLKNFGTRALFAQGNFKNIKKISHDVGLSSIGGMVLDLGFSRGELEDEARGLSFLRDAPLDMRFDESGEITAGGMVNHATVEDLTAIFRGYGEERYARAIAKAIVRRREEHPFTTTFELVETIKSAVPKSYQRKHLHPATKTFQALRIAVNDELENLKIFLPDALDVLERGGRLAIISFHSLEDRIVKRFFKEQSKSCVCPPEAPVCRCEGKARLKILTKKVVVPSEEEIKRNPWSRSAKLRVAEKL